MRCLDGKQQLTPPPIPELFSGVSQRPRSSEKNEEDIEISTTLGLQICWEPNQAQLPEAIAVANMTGKQCKWIGCGVQGSLLPGSNNANTKLRANKSVCSISSRLKQADADLRADVIFAGDAPKFVRSTLLEARRSGGKRESEARKEQGE